ncbi:MAG: hypothetical protein U1A77_01900 [Pirellulales bacterium]
MNRFRLLAQGNRPASNRKLRRVHFEGLERRLAMAIDCNVTCELTNEQLTVVGSAEDDLIEIRFNETTRSLQVLGDGQLLGEYAADTISSLVVQGLAGDDQLCVDSNLPLACYVDGGEGEDQLQLISAVTPVVRHSHGVAGSGATGSLIFERNIEQITSASALANDLANDLATDLTNPQADNGSGEGEAASSLAANSLVLTSLFGVSSTSHGEHAGGVISIDGSSHQGSHLAFGSAMIVASGDEHASHAAAALAGIAVIAAEDVESLGAASSNNSSDGSAHHGGQATSAKSNEIAKKWCTTTPLANRLVTTLEGKPTCFCREPEAGAEGGNLDRSQDDNGATGLNLSCSPRISAWDSILADLDAGHVCSEKTTDELVASMTSMFARERQRIAAGDRVEAEAGDAESQGLADYISWAGWGLAAVGIYLAPLLLKRLETEADRQAREQADAERYQLELLNVG